MLLIDARDVLPALAGLVFAYPWAALALGRGRTPLLTALVTLALSLGALTLAMLGLALAGALSRNAIWAMMAIVLGAGLALLARRERTPRRRGRIAWLRAEPLAAVALGVTGLMLLLIMFNLLYWPFNDDDAVSIYAPQSRAIYETRALPRDGGLYEAYPLLVPLSYTYAHLVAGELDEYLARGFAAALALGAFGAAGALGATLYDRRTGLIAALLLALTPIFVLFRGAGGAVRVAAGPARRRARCAAGRDHGRAGGVDQEQRAGVRGVAGRDCGLRDAAAPGWGAPDVASRGAGRAGAADDRWSLVSAQSRAVRAARPGDAVG